jgi:hypothetical protein
VLTRVAAVAIHRTIEQAEVSGAAGIQRDVAAEDRSAKCVVELDQGRQRVRHHIIAGAVVVRINRVEVDLDGTEVEVERTVEIRLQTDFMRILLARPAGFIEGPEQVGHAKLRIAHHATREQKIVNRFITGGQEERTGRFIERDGRRNLVVVLNRGRGGFRVAAQIGEEQAVGDVPLAFPGDQVLVGFIHRVEG